MILLHAKKVGCRSDFSGGMPLHSWSGPLDEPHDRHEDDGSHEADEEIAQEAASHGEVAEEKSSEPASCDAQQDVCEKAIASALHDLSGCPARERAKREFHD